MIALAWNRLYYILTKDYLFYSNIFITKKYRIGRTFPPRYPLTKYFFLHLLKIDNLILFNVSYFSRYSEAMLQRCLICFLLLRSVRSLQSISHFWRNITILLAEVHKFRILNKGLNWGDELVISSSWIKLQRCLVRR